MTVQTRIAIGQLCSSSNISKNLRVTQDLISKAIEKDVRLIFFPEATDYLSKNTAHLKYLAHQSPLFIVGLQKYIKEITTSTGKRIDVSVGVHSEPNQKDLAVKDDRVKNILLYINHRGEIAHSYQKLHLFDVAVPNGPIMKESKSVQPGTIIPEIIDTPVGKLGTSICYDIRFPELALKLRSLGAKMICYPSAFTMKTGEDHWELLGRARAIDTQCYVIMPGQKGEHDVADPEYDLISGNTDKTIVKRQSWGESMIISPWGKIISKSNKDINEPQLIIADLDFGELEKIRSNMPLWSHRRDDLFPQK